MYSHSPLPCPLSTRNQLMPLHTHGNLNKHKWLQFYSVCSWWWYQTFLEIFQSYREHTTPLFHSLKILKLNDIYNYQVALLMFKNSKNCLPPSISNNLKNRSKFHSHNTRFAKNIHIPLRRTYIAKCTILFQGPNIWNNLPRNITTISSIAIFKGSVTYQVMMVLFYSW